MSDNQPAILASFINRRTGQRIEKFPLLSRISINKDIRQLCDSFDFEIAFRVSEKIDLHSHDFVEFYILLDGNKFQVCCGYLEDFVKETSSNSHTFKANGRDFLGQLFSVPFLIAKPLETTTLPQFVESILGQTYTVDKGAQQDTYLSEYLRIKNVPRKVLDLGAYKGPVNIPELSDAKIAPVLQATADEVFTTVYQNRHGQVVLFGRDHEGEILTNNQNGDLTLDKSRNPNDNDTGLILHELADINTMKFTLRENFSKVYSQVKIFYTGGEGFIGYKNTPSREIFNSEKKARQIFQPEIRSFQTQSLITRAGSLITVSDLKDQQAASIIRKSNQNLTQVVVRTSRPYFIKPDGSKIPYEVNQIWHIKADSFSVNEKMRLVGIGYTYDSSSMDVQLMFIGRDTLT